MSRAFPKMPIAVIVAWVTLMHVGAVSADQIVQSATVSQNGLGPSAISSSVSFGQFNSALGTLTGVTAVVQGSISGFVSVSNTGPSTFSYSYSASGLLTATLPTGNNLNLTITQAQSGLSIPPDGNTYTFNIAQNGSTNANDTGLSTYIGTGNVNVNTGASSTFSDNASGNTSGGDMVNSSTTITLTYTYNPTGGSSGGGGGGGGSGGGGGAGGDPPAGGSSSAPEPPLPVMWGVAVGLSLLVRRLFAKRRTETQPTC